MLKLHTKALAVIATAGLFCAASGAANAQTTVQGNVNLTVNNAINITETTPMQFGTFLVVKDIASTEVATLTLSDTGTATPTTTGTPAIFTDISAVAPAARSQGIFGITGAAPTTVINVATSNLADLTCALCTGSDTITLFSVTPATATVTTDGTGAATINVGAVLKTKTGGNQYKDGLYAGTYDLTVNY